MEHPSTPSLHKAAVVLSLKYLRKVVYAIILQQVMKNRHIGKLEQKKSVSKVASMMKNDDDEDEKYTISLYNQF